MAGPTTQKEDKTIEIMLVVVEVGTLAVAKVLTTTVAEEDRRITRVVKRLLGQSVVAIPKLVARTTTIIPPRPQMHPITRLVMVVLQDQAALLETVAMGLSRSLAPSSRTASKHS
jgi:hypothetical protein